MEHSRDEETEAMLGDIIANRSDEVASFLLDSVGQLEERGEEEGYVHDGSGPLMPVQKKGYVHDGSGDDPMEVQEGNRADCSGDRTESGQVYIYIS